MLVEHHIKYLEIHGVDKTVWMNAGTHNKLHRKLRQTGKCNVAVDELAIISREAHRRTIKYKDRTKGYYKQQIIEFTENLQPFVELRERIVVSKTTGNINYLAGFRGKNGNKLFYGGEC